MVGRNAYLLFGHLLVLVDVQGFKQVLRSVLEPHKQVAGRHALLEAVQFNVEDQHGAAGHTSG